MSMEIETYFNPPPPNSIHATSYHESQLLLPVLMDSPSRQLLRELQHYSIYQRRDFHSHLDDEDERRKTAQLEALARASEEHEKIRQVAEAARARLEASIREEQERRQRSIHEEAEKARKQKELRELRAAQEALKREEEAQRVAQEQLAIERRRAELAKEQERTRQEQEAAKKEKERQEDARNKANAAAAKQLEEQPATNGTQQPPVQPLPSLVQPSALEEAKAKARASVQSRTSTPRIENGTAQANQPPPRQAPKSNVDTSRFLRAALDPNREVDHAKYLNIHQNLKQLRNFLTEEGKTNRQLKVAMGDSRRTIRKCVGQLTMDKQSNMKPRNEIVQILKGAMQMTTPSVDIRLFLLTPPDTVATANPSVSALLIYLFNIFCKAVVSQFAREACVSPRAADPIGVIASAVFANADLQWHGKSLIDILLAKLHVVVPVAFGIFGLETTPEGKRRLGWLEKKIKDDNDNVVGRAFISEQEHYDRMSGLGAGFAALSLRNYDKSSLTNPFPEWRFWYSAASILNIPAEYITNTHFTFLKSMFAGSEKRLLELFGNAGIALLREALIRFPKKGMYTDSVAAKQLALLAEVLRRDHKFTNFH